MGNNNQDIKSRRWFLSLFSNAGNNTVKTDKVKMLTADGKLVEIDRAVLNKASTGEKSTNKEILHWMDNPSKK